MPTLVEDAIASGQVQAEIIRPGVPTPTVSAAASALGVSESSVLKSLLFLTPAGEGVLAIACGQSKVDATKLAAAAGVERVKLAPPEEVERRTGYPVGGASPVCHATPLTVIVDCGILDLEFVYGGGGAADLMLRISPSEITRVTGASFADIVRR